MQGLRNGHKVCQSRENNSGAEMKKSRIAVLALMAGMILVACGEDEPAQSVEESEAITARAQALMPNDAALAEVYEYSCYSCHANPQSGAPLTGDIAAWQPRLAKGMDALLESTINGFAGMPPLGMCMDCSEDQFAALIRFMSRTE